MQTTKPTFDDVVSRFKEQGAEKREYDSNEYLVNADRTIALIQPDMQTFAENSLAELDTKPESIETREESSSKESFSLFDISANSKTHSIQQKYIEQIEELTERTINLNEHAQMNAEHYDFPVLIDIPDSEMRFIVSPCIV